MGIGRRPGNAGKHRWPAAEGRAEPGSLALEAFLFISWCFSILASGFRDSAREGQYGAILWYVLRAVLALPRVNTPCLRLSLAGPWVQIICRALVCRYLRPVVSVFHLRRRGSRPANCPPAPSEQSPGEGRDQLWQSPVHQQSCHQESMWWGSVVHLEAGFVPQDLGCTLVLSFPCTLLRGFRGLFIHSYVTWLNCTQIQIWASE